MSPSPRNPEDLPSSAAAVASETEEAPVVSECRLHGLTITPATAVSHSKAVFCTVGVYVYRMSMEPRTTVNCCSLKWITPPGRCGW